MDFLYTAIGAQEESARKRRRRRATQKRALNIPQNQYVPFLKIQFELKRFNDQMEKIRNDRHSRS